MKESTIGKMYRSEGEWREILSRLESSGGTQKSFCEREGISLTSLQKWQRKFKGEKNGAPFVELGSIGAEKRSEVEVRFPSGLILRVGG